MAKRTKKQVGRLGGLKTAKDRDHMREIGRKGGQSTAQKPGHIARITQLSVESRRAKKETKTNE